VIVRYFPGRVVTLNLQKGLDWQICQIKNSSLVIHSSDYDSSWKYKHNQFRDKKNATRDKNINPNKHDIIYNVLKLILNGLHETNQH
jgi:hypothetical protein